MKKTISIILLFASCVAVYATQGALSGVFSVSATKKVQFSQGNLQYQASTKTWRFAANQYDYIGDANKNVSSSYSGWIDLFAYGTSGYNSCYPYKTSQGSQGYYGYAGNGYGGEANINNTNYDWGKYCAISNGGNQANLWRTLTKDEWDYLLTKRTNATQKRTLATVNGMNGIILLPDNWSAPVGITFAANASSYSSNQYSTTQWNTLQNNGAVFLPAAGTRGYGWSYNYSTNEYNAQINDIGSIGKYWTSTYKSENFWGDGVCTGYTVYFKNGVLPYTMNLLVQNSTYNYCKCNFGYSVRLVQDATTSYTVTLNPCGGSVSPTTKSVSAGGTYGTLPTPTRDGFTFDGWYTATSGGTKITSSSTVTITSNQILYAHWTANKYTITFNANGGLIPTGGNMGIAPAGYTTTLSADRKTGTVVTRTNTSDFWKMANDCPTRDGYIFDGWWTDPVGGTQVYDATGVCITGTAYWDVNTKWIWLSNVTLYAHWTANKYTITFNANGGLIPMGGNMGTPPAGHIITLSPDRKIGSVMVTYGIVEFRTMTDDCPTRDGYIFDGWWTALEEGEQVYDASGTYTTGTYWDIDGNWIGTSDLTVYAHWISTEEKILPGKFSINDSTMVRFAPGNLQYRATPGTHECADGTTKPGIWRFAEHQYDVIGEPNQNIAETYTGWIDLFGWGTSGWNSGVTAYQPWSKSKINSDYLSADMVGEYVYADWSVYNAILNGGNKPNLWRILSEEEVMYLINGRANASEKRGAAVINGIPGMIVLPDDWVQPEGVVFNAQLAASPATQDYTNYVGINDYSLVDWEIMENAGALFLPATGRRYVVTPIDGKYHGYYWTSTSHVDNVGVIMSLNADRFWVSSTSDKVKWSGLGVRAIKRLFTINVKASGDSQSVVAGSEKGIESGETRTIFATPADCYRFARWSDGNTSNPRTVTVTEDATYTAIFEKVQYTITTAPDDAAHGSTEAAEKE